MQATLRCMATRKRLVAAKAAAWKPLLAAKHGWLRLAWHGSGYCLWEGQSDGTTMQISFADVAWALHYLIDGLSHCHGYEMRTRGLCWAALRASCCCW